MKSVIVHAPQGSRKSLHAEEMRKHFRLDRVVEEFEALRANEIHATGELYLASMNPLQTCRAANVKALGIRVIALKDALQQCGK